MAKSNVYRYFESREALLLELLWDEWAGWFPAMAKSIRKPKAGDALAPLVRHVARTIAARPLLCALTAALPSVLEQNLSEAAILDFKVRSLALLREGAAFFASCAPQISAEAWARLIHDAMAVIAGLHPFAHPAEPAARVLDDPALRFYRRDFGADLERFLLALAEAERARGAGKK
jgi:AcrR family transcriptional regulator